MQVITQIQTEQNTQKVVIGTRGKNVREQVVVDPQNIPTMKAHLWQLGYSVQVVERTI